MSEPRSPDRSQLVQPRLAIAVVFCMYGVILGAWTTRIPAVKHGARLSDGALSIALLAFAAGAIIGMQLSGRLVDAFGSRRVLVPALFLDVVLLITPALATGLVVLAASLLAFGVAHGMLNIAMNVKAVELQTAWGAPIVTSFHAAYSIGGFIGAGIGGLFAFVGAGALATFVSVAVLVAAVAAVVAGRIPHAVGTDEHMPRSGRGRRHRGRRERRQSALTFLGILVFCCLVGEGAAADWSAVYLQDTLHTSAALAAAPYAAFAIFMTVGRLLGDRLVAALGPVLLVRVGGAVASVGLAAGLLVPHATAGIVGFACLGAGLSCIAPQVFAAAANRNPATAGNAIAHVASLGFLGFVVGPVVIGRVADVVGLRSALIIPAVLAAFVAVAATALRSTPRPAADVVEEHVP